MKESNAAFIALAVSILAACGTNKTTAPDFVCPAGWTCAPAPPPTQPAAPAATCAPNLTGQKVRVEPTSLPALEDAVRAEVAARPDLFYPDGGVIGWPTDWDSQWKIASGAYEDLIRRLSPRCAYYTVPGEPPHDSLTVRRDDGDWDDYHVFNFSGSFNKGITRGYQATLVSVK